MPPSVTAFTTSLFCLTSLAAAGRSAAVFALVAAAVGRHQHSAIGASGRAVMLGLRARGRFPLFGGRGRNRNAGRRRGVAIGDGALRQVVGGNEASAEPSPEDSWTRQSRSRFRSRPMVSVSTATASR